MSLALLQNALLMPFELALNGVLALDAASKARMQRMSGSTLAVHVTQPALSLYVSVRGERLNLSSIHEGPETATLSGSASALLGLLLRGQRVESLHGTDLELRGDTGFAQQLQTLLLDLDIDWEYHLSRVLGDIPTQAVADGARVAGEQLRKTGMRARENIDEYLHEEAALLPNSAALEAFYRDVAELKLRADRLQARLAVLKARPLV